MKSGTRLFFNTCDKTIIVILNFKISLGGWGRGGGIPAPHIKRTLMLSLLNFHTHGVPAGFNETR